MSGRGTRGGDEEPESLVDAANPEGQGKADGSGADVDSEGSDGGPRWS